MQRNRADFSGDFRNIVISVGANDIGSCGIREAIEDIAETLELLQILNPGADTFACEVSLQTFLFEPGLKLDEKSIENGLEGQKFLVVCLFWGGCHHPNTPVAIILRFAQKTYPRMHVTSI